MSLTSLLDDKEAPVRRFLEEKLPNLAGVRKRIRDLGPPGILPQKGEHTSHPWSIIGMAFDYRFRYFFGITPPDEFVAATGARLRANKPAGYENLTAELTALLERNTPVGRILDPANEARLARHCYVLSLYECYVRSTGRNSPLETIEATASADEQLRLVPEAAVSDLCALAIATVEHCESFLRRRPVTLNPTFGMASSVVGGADADLVVDGCLVEVKTTKAAKFKRSSLYQPIAYALLDRRDRHGIREIAFYLPRVPALPTWGLTELLTEMAGHAVHVDGVRAGFWRAVEAAAAQSTDADMPGGRVVRRRRSTLIA